MKILRVINCLNIGGAERSIAGNVPIHNRNGYEMSVLLLDGKESFYLDELKKQNIRINWLGINNNIYNPFLIFKIRVFLNKYDIIHVHLFPSFYWIALAKIIFFSKTKLVYTEHNTENRRRNNWILKKIDIIIYRQYDTIITISNASKQNLIKHIKSHSNIQTIHNGVDISKLQIEAKMNLKKELSKYYGKKVLIQIASFRKQKDQDTLIKALQFLPDDYIVLFIGDGERRIYCEELSREINVQHKVDFLGIRDNVGAYINIADIMVMSSNYEGFGRAAVEGMALKKPVIASNVEGLSDVVRGAGLLFEVGDYEHLAFLIESLTNNRHYYDQVAQKCFERAKKYDISYMINEYENVYDRFLKK